MSTNRLKLTRDMQVSRHSERIRSPYVPMAPLETQRRHFSSNILQCTSRRAQLSDLHGMHNSNGDMSDAMLFLRLRPDNDFYVPI